jgi:hypothetical protein
MSRKIKKIIMDPDTSRQFYEFESMSRYVTITKQFLSDDIGLDENKES